MSVLKPSPTERYFLRRTAVLILRAVIPGCPAGDAVKDFADLCKTI